MRDGELQLGRLGDDGPVRRYALEHGLCPGRRKLLVTDRGHDDVAAQTVGIRSSDENRGERALHVVAPATVEPAVLDARLERRSHARDTDRVEMAVEEQRAAASRPAPSRDHTGTSLAQNLDLEPAPTAPVRDEKRGLALPRAARDERGVDRVDRDEPRCELDEVVPLAHLRDPTPAILRSRDGR